MPARNMDSTVEKFLTRFYPGLTGMERGQKAGAVRAWLHTALSTCPSGMSTRKLEALYASDRKDDPNVKPRGKLGEAKKVHDFYVLQNSELVAGPFVSKAEAIVTADGFVDGEVITATEARRKGYLDRYKEVKALA